MKDALERTRRLLVLGIGRTGKATCHFGLKQKWEVCAIEENTNPQSLAAAKELEREGVKVLFQPIQETDPGSFDLIVPSPGVPLPEAFLQKVSASQKEILSEIELAYRCFPHKHIVGVTGTNGKTTTVQLIHHMLCALGKDSVLCGNIGTPFIEIAPGMRPEQIVVLEISSFQLEHIKRFKPRVAVYLNIAQDHLDRHQSFEDYFHLKTRLFQNASGEDTAVLYAEDEKIRALSSRFPGKTLFFSLSDHSGPGAFIEGERIFFRVVNKTKELGMVSTLPYRTLPFLENALAALCAVAPTIPPEKAIQTLKRFRLSPHRLEVVTTIAGISFINDSKATNPHAVRGALLSMEGKVVLILGGKGKGLSYDSLFSLLQEKAKSIVLIGEERHKLKKVLSQLDLPLIEADSMKEAVHRAFQQALPDATVLFSPGCTSFDWYENYEERGDDFKKEVKALVAERKA